MSLVARHLEAEGIPTVILGSARDIVELAGVPRFVFTDYPLGNPTGKPDDIEDQQSILDLGLAVLEGAIAPRTTVQSPNIWSESEQWRADFMHVGPDNIEALRAAGEARRAAQETS